MTPLLDGERGGATEAGQQASTGRQRRAMFVAAGAFDLAGSRQALQFLHGLLLRPRGESGG